MPSPSSSGGSTVPRIASVPGSKNTTTPEARLTSIIKTARDIMRKDAGLNGDLDRIPQIAWLLFLKAFDDLEDRRALLEEDDYEPVLAEKYRWHVGLGPDQAAHRPRPPEVRQRRLAAPSRRAARDGPPR